MEQTATSEMARDALSTAMKRAGHMLAARARTEKEIRDRLLGAGFDQEVVAQTIERLIELQLLDDAVFARHWIDERARAKGLAGRALLHELLGKGVEVAVAEEALAEAGLDEERQARELAARYITKLRDLPLERQAARLQQMLMRRGYSMDTAVASARAVLPPEGWD